MLSVLVQNFIVTNLVVNLKVTMIIWLVYHRYCCKYAQIRRVRNSETVANVEVLIIWYICLAILKFCGTIMSTVIYYTKAIPN